MTLFEFLGQCKKMVEENPEALHMEMFAVHSASGAPDEIGYPFVQELSRWENDREFDLFDMLPRDYKYDKIIKVSTGN